MATTLTDRAFRDKCDAIYKVVLARLDQEDPDDVEAELSAGVVKIKTRSGKTYVLNHQAPIFEVWYAAGDRAWHFQYQDSQWIDPRNGDELAQVLGATISREVGRSIVFALPG
jgi:CyaY protein